MENTEVTAKKPITLEDDKFKNFMAKFFAFFCIFLIIVVVAFFLGNFIFKRKKELSLNLEKLNNENTNILQQIRDIDTKSQIAKKYITIWENDFKGEQKELKGLDITKINSRILSIALENKLADVIINFSPVTLIDNPSFDKTKIRTFTTLVSLKFGAVTDVNLFQFLDDLKNQLDYFITIEDIEMKRTKKIDTEFIKKLTSGNIITAVDCDVKVRIYGLGAK